MKEYFRKLKYLFSWKDMIFTLVIFAIILAIAFARGDTLVESTLGETSVDIVSGRFNMNIPYEMIDRLELTDRLEGQLLDGKGDLALHTGTWTNDSWGEYEAILDLDADNCILAHLTDGRLFVFSQDDDKATEQLYEELLERIG